MSDFIFPKAACRALHTAAIEAEKLTCLDVRTTYFYTRYVLNVLFASL